MKNIKTMFTKIQEEILKRTEGIKYLQKVKLGRDEKKRNNKKCT
jgi:hypothetical protein